MSPYATYVTHAHLKLLQSLRRLFLYKMNDKKTTTADKRQKRNARDRARRASETEAQREERLRKRREKDRARKALVASSESQEERASRLEHKNALKRQRLTDETDKERATRLELMQQRLVAESKEERATRLENVQPDQHLPPFEQHCVQSAMQSFHQEMSTIDTPTCSTCMEKFPGMKVNGQSECLSCARDKNVPKLYSLDNNVHPGHIPPQLQVSITS